MSGAGVTDETEQRWLWRIRAEAFLASAPATRDPTTAADLIVLARAFERRAQFAATLLTSLPDMQSTRSGE